MRRPKFWLVAVLVLGLLYSWPAFGEELDGKAIVKKMSDRAQSTSSIINARMSIVESNNTKRVREMRIRSKKINNKNNVVTTFISPPDVRGVKFLTIENPGGDDDQRLYLPAQKRIRRITSSNKSESFMGSTFSYADLQTPSTDKFDHKRLGDKSVYNQDCYTVQSAPKNAVDSEYSKIIYYVRKDNWIPIRGEFFNKDGKLWKVMDVFKMDQKPDGTWLEINDFKVNVAIDDTFFTDRFLTDESQE